MLNGGWCTLEASQSAAPRPSATPMESNPYNHCHQLSHHGRHPGTHHKNLTSDRNRERRGKEGENWTRTMQYGW